MRTEKKEIQKIEYEYTYIANDGTEFKSEDECRKYEETAKCAIFGAIKRLEYQETRCFAERECDLFTSFSCDDNMYAFRIRNVDDLEVINRWIHLVNIAGDKLGTDAIGTIQLINTYCDDEDVWLIGTVEQFKERICKQIDKLVDKLVKKEGDES